jgi:hypothetical protein
MYKKYKSWMNFIYDPRATILDELDYDLLNYFKVIFTYLNTFDEANKCHV